MKTQIMGQKSYIILHKLYDLNHKYFTTIFPRIIRMSTNDNTNYGTEWLTSHTNCEL